ncbi:SDR family oxidoreductase [Pseudodesulfovibrio portus]|uniref:NAD(P)-dependent oxidoreductase n=1 Tax=Pseudodesulfovibrio portus TaxID=231439 RepID=A0ABM8AT38_9BACT|nr:SDR family oxidoreductase [Pseudodesulfovibrio portus]BDQ34449.1 NAD(P)-dependent oxidoreductase [Pseudodesulfovibrio portus]
MGRIFIAGAAGNIGSALVEELDRDGIVAGVHSPEKAETLAGKGVEARVFDFADADSMARAMDGCDRLFLVLPFREELARYGRLAVDAAKAAGIEYIVRSSGYGASSDAHWRLGREQGMVDQFVEDSEIPFTTLRPNSFMQNFIGPLAPMVRSGVIALPEEDYAVSYIDVRDIAACAARLLTDGEGHTGNAYALTGPEGLTLHQVAGKIAAAGGITVTYTPVEEEAFIRALDTNGVPEWNRNMLVSLSRVVKLGMMGNVTQAVEYLTGTPARSFDGFAEENAGAWKQP